MYLGPYTLFDIIDTGEGKLFQVTKIVFDIEARLNQTLDSTDGPLKDNTIKTCQEHNGEQVITIIQSIKEVRGYLNDNPDSTKRENQLKYLSNTLDHFVNWYKDEKLPMPDKLPAMEWKTGSFSANKDFSKINLDNKLYRLRRNQSKVVELLFKNLTDELDGLTYPEIARELDLTDNRFSSKLSNYFKGLPRVGDLFNYSRRTGKYSLRH
tara:strand:- start:169 stop:798 length:630 start_codon:yes stop_codon:yes gene_type:complete